MYSKQAASQLRQEFWTKFGQYMAPVPGADGNKINWVNYKTGIKSVFFRMDADNSSASIAIVINHPNTTYRQQMFHLLQQTRSILESELPGNWHWESEAVGTNAGSSRAWLQLDNVNIYRQEDWPAIISFFKSGMVGLDEYWWQVKDGFQI